MDKPESAIVNREEVKDFPFLSIEEQQYHGAIMTRLARAKEERDMKHVEFNNKTFLEYYLDNERLANTFIERKTYDNGVVIASGTVEQKLYAVLSEVNRLNLSPEVKVFDKENIEYQKLGVALTDIIFKTEQIEKDEEFKLMRQLEMLKQGHVFVQDNWVCEYKPDKNINNKFIGKVSGVEWTSRLKKVFEGPKRSLLYAPGVYLGNIREFDMKKQPFIFTFKVSSYDEVKSRFGGKNTDGTYVWERWNRVPRNQVPLIDSTTNVSAFDFKNGFSLSSVQVDQVEEVYYQDELNNEFQIYLNGIPMLPAGFPLSAVTAAGEFNITKQVLQVINPFFAYGRSFVIKTRELSDLLDEMLRLFILKTRKSIHPPYANISGKVISAKSLMPGVISMNVDPGALVPIGKEGEGVTSSEYQMLRELREDIDRVTVSPQVQGQPGKSGTTAFEVSQLQKQAQKVLGLVIFAASLLEKKLADLRLKLILWKYFDPIDTRYNEEQGDIKNIFRQVSRKTNIENRGYGTRYIVPTDQELPTPQDIADEEDYMDVPEPEDGSGHRRRMRDELGMEPIEKIYLSIPELRLIDWVFYIEIDAREKDTTNNAKLMFREELKDIAALQSMGSVPNVQEIENEYARIWNRRRERLFSAPNVSLPDEGSAMGGSAILNQSSPTPMPEGV